MAYRSSGFQIMNISAQDMIALAASVSAAAHVDDLNPEAAIKFCKHVLPRLLVELEVARRVDERLAAAFPLPPAQPPCEATICSSRWTKPEPAAKAKKAKKASGRKRKAKGGDK